tara:strand:- start:347 stop:1321 length:975 start_codon:yes stop_codon:yes gene_type:complete
MSLGIVILNWNGKKLLKQFLPPLIKYTSNEHNIYVIDNGSNDNSIDFIKNNFKRIKTIKLDRNYGYAKGYNIGLKSVNEDILCLLNNDVEVTENWTDDILQQFDLEPKTAVIQPKMKNYYKRTEFDYAGAAGGFLDKYGYPYCKGRIYKNIEKDNNQYDNISNIFWACGACFFIRKNIFEIHNGFDEKFWAHMEEIDLCWRIQNSKYDIKLNHNAEVFHANAATLNQNNPKKTYLNFRNKLFMITKNSRNNLFFLLLEKFIIDLIVSIYLLFNKGFNHFTAIIKAYISFYKHINLLIGFRKKNKRFVKHYQIRSIIFEYLFDKR